MLCIQCGAKPAVRKKRTLCIACNWMQWNKKRKEKPSTKWRTRGPAGAEREFADNFFGHNNWLYEPATFKTDYFHYTPDFYDSERNVFIEVAGSRQAYHANKSKYELFRKSFPAIKFEIRKADGSLLDEMQKPLQWDSD